MFRLTVLALALGLGAATVEQQWTDYKKTYGKSYSSPEEEARRFGNFEKYVARVEKLNAKNVAAGGDVAFGITFGADHDDDEVCPVSVHVPLSLPTSKHHDLETCDSNSTLALTLARERPTLH